MSVTVEIRDSDNSLEGIIEVQDSLDFPLSLTYGVADIKDVTPKNKRWRGGTFSKDFEAAGSQANDQLLQHIYDTNIEDTKDVKASKDCIVKVDGIPYMHGKFRVIFIDTIVGVKTYKCRVTGDNLVWVDRFNDIRLNELDWGTHTFDGVTVSNSWSSSTLDYYYPFTNYGKWDQTNQVSIEDLRPGVYFKSIFDKAFASIGYTVESNFMDSFQFGECFRLFTGTGFKHPQSILDDNQYTATKTSNQASTHGSKPANIDLDLFIPIQFETTDNASVFDTFTERFNVAVQGEYSFDVSFDIKVKQLEPDENFIVVRKNGLILEKIQFFFSDGVDTTVPGFPGANDIIISFGGYLLDAGDFITLDYEAVYTADIAMSSVEITIKSGTFWSNSMSPQFVRGITVDLADQLPDTPIINYINGITHSFNLHWKTNVAERKVFVEPFDAWDDINDVSQEGFYKTIASANNFTSDLDISKKYQVGFLSDYKRELRYQYKEDGKDDFLGKINEAQQESFGSYKHTFSDRFREGEDPSENPTFAFTYYIKDQSISKNQLRDESPLLARLWKESKVNGEVPDFDTDFEERICYRNYATQGTVEVKYEGAFITQIPTGLSYGDRATDLDLKYNGTNGLVATYYASQLNVIEKGIFVNAFLNLNEANIQKIENGDLIKEPLYISDPVDLKGYYLINQINDVTPQNATTYRFELIKYENKNPVSIDAGQSDGIGNGPFGEEDLFSPGLGTTITPTEIPVWMEATIEGTETAYLHVTMLDTTDNVRKKVIIST